MFCTRCGTANSDDARFCKACSAGLSPDRSATSRVVIAPPAKSPGVAAVLSFFICGLGQIYNGEIGKGLFMIVAYIISVCLIAVVLGFVTTPILWIWGMVDAYRTAERLNLAATALPMTS